MTITERKLWLIDFNQIVIAIEKMAKKLWNSNVWFWRMKNWNKSNFRPTYYFEKTYSSFLNYFLSHFLKLLMTYLCCFSFPVILNDLTLTGLVWKFDDAVENLSYFLPIKINGYKTWWPLLTILQLNKINFMCGRYMEVFCLLLRVKIYPSWVF